MEVIRRALRLTVIALLVAAITSVAYLAGYGAGTEGVSAPAQVQVEKVAPWPTDIGSAAAATPSRDSVPDDARPSSFDVFWESWHILQHSFYGDLPDDEEMTYGAIRGVLDLLGDKHTSLLEPEQANAWTSSLHGTFEGIGALVDTWSEGGILIVEPFREQPAWEAGLRAGDVILAVDDVDVTDMSLDQAILLIRGVSGSSVRLSILRPSAPAPFDVQVVRSRIQVPVVRSEMLDQGIAYVRLSEFTSQAPDELESALTALIEQEPVGLILDLRGNPGGLLSSAVEVGGLLVDGDIVSQRNQKGLDQSLAADRSPVIEDTPLVVLVNGASASASEIVAGAVQDYERGVLVGEPTFGKGSVQTPYPLADGSLLRVTTAYWFTPMGRAINEEGLTPDVLVEVNLEDIDPHQDPQLQRAIEILSASMLDQFMEATGGSTLPRP